MIQSPRNSTCNPVLVVEAESLAGVTVDLAVSVPPFVSTHKHTHTLAPTHQIFKKMGCRYHYNICSTCWELDFLGHVHVYFCFLLVKCLFWISLREISPIWLCTVCVKNYFSHHSLNCIWKLNLVDQISKPSFVF